MVDEKDTSVEESWYRDQVVQRSLEALKKNNFDPEYVPNRAAALSSVIGKIPAGASIGCADSVTLHQIGFFDWLGCQNDHEVFNPFSIQIEDFDGDWDKFRKERYRLSQKAMTANVFVTGTSAVTQDGKLVNVDGTGNRVAALIFGPNKAIVVVGVNKIVKDVDQALERIRNYSAPLAGRRHVEKHGFRLSLACVLTGSCNHCHAENRNCRITTIIDGWTPMVHCSTQERTSIIIVAESLGF